jgi:DNA-binding GntR family transcriptional regulator
LEAVVSVRAARCALDSERQHLLEIADTIEAAGRSENVRDYLLSHFELKRLVALYSRNPYAARALQPLHTFSQRFYFIYHQQFNNLEEVGNAHAQLSRAIASGDVVRTEQCSTHVSDIAEAFTRRLLLDAA